MKDLCAAARKGRAQPVYLGEDCHLNAYNRLELATDPALRELWGRYTRQLWDDIHDTAGCLGQSIWSGVDDTFYLPNGERAKGNGELITELAACAARAGRSIASPQEARALLGLHS